MSSDPSNSTEIKSHGSSKSVKLSPCSRYARHEKNPENMIGAEIAYLGMDLEEGTEVAWGEAQLKNISNNDLIRIKHIFDRIIQFKHPNLLKYHTYWIEETSDKQYCVYFITERVDNSILQFIKRTKNSKKIITPRTQSRYCNQILLGLSYLHSLNPPFYFTYFGCDTVLITHDGTIKIAPVFPASKISGLIEDSTKIINNFEIDGDRNENTIAKNIHNFGTIAYALATLDYSLQEISNVTNYNSSNIDPHSIFSTLSTEHKDLIITCLKDSSSCTIPELLKHKILFEIPTLKLIAGHGCVKYGIDMDKYNPDDHPSDKVFATIYFTVPKKIFYSDIPSFDAKKYILHIADGLYPLTGILSSDSVKKSSDLSAHTSPTTVTEFNSPIDYINPAEQRSSINDNIEQSSDSSINNSDDKQVIAIQCRLSKYPMMANTESGGSTSSTLLKQKKYRLTVVLFYRKHYSRHAETDIDPTIDTGELLAEDLIYNMLAPEKARSVLTTTLERALKGEQVLVTSAYCK